MASQIDICNQALALIGLGSITDLNEANAVSAKCLVFWEQTRDEALRLAEWNFALTRVQLALNAQAPAYGYDYAYEKPADCVRLLRVSPNVYDLDNKTTPAISYKVEGRTILCNETTLYCKYVRQVAETGLYDSLFTGALAARMAWKLAGSLALSAKLVERMLQLSNYLISEASGVNVVESGTTQRRVSSSWLDAHRGSSYASLRPNQF